MSANVREKAQELKRKYCRFFGLYPDEVQIREFVNDKDQEDAELSCSDPSVPKWTVGA